MLFCKHKWKILDKTIIPSRYEIYQTMKQYAVNAFAIDLERMSLQKTIISYTCEHCGKLKIITETN